MTGARRMLVALLVLASAAVGCAHGSAEAGASAEVSASGAQASGSAGRAARRRPPPAPDPLRLVPDDAFAVVDVELDRLRRSPYYERVVRWWLSQTRLDPDRQRVARDVLERTHRVVLGVLRPGTPGEDPEWVVVTRGDYHDGELAKVMRHTGPVSEVQTIEGRPVYVESDVWAAEVAGPTWVFANAGWVRGLLERTDPALSGTSPLDHEPMRAMAERVGFGHDMITAVAEVPPEIRDRLGDDRWLSRDTGQALRYAGARLRLDSGADLEVVVQTTDERSGARLSGRLVELLEWGGRNVLVSMLGLGPVFQGTKVRPDRDAAIVSVQLDDVQVRSLLARLEAMAGQVLDQRGVSLEVGGAPSTVHNP